MSVHGSHGRSLPFGGHPPPGGGRHGAARRPAEWPLPWRHHQTADAARIDALTGLPDGEDFTQVRAWEHERAGRVRARLRAPRTGEDEACGGASMLLARKLGRPLQVLHGRHRAAVHVRPVDDVRVELGGRCVLDRASTDVRAAVDALDAG